jgi:Major Facilitator Superfamily
VISPISAQRRFMLLSALRWLPPGVSIPVLVLLVTSRGYSLATVGALFALHGAVVVALELPTGGIADVLGRRRALLTSSVLNVLAALTFAVALELWTFVLAVVLLGAGRALGSGPLEAWYVDTVHAADPMADLKPGLSRAHSAEAIALAVGAIAGGVLPVLLADVGSGGGVITPLAIPMIVAAALGAIHLLAVAALVVEPTGQQSSASLRGSMRDVPATIRAGLRLARLDRTVLRLLVVAGVVGVALAGLELLVPAQFADLLGEQRASAVYGVVIAVAFVASAAGGVAAPRAARLAGTSARAAFGFMVATAAAILGVGIATSFLLAAVAIVASYLLLGGASPLKAELLHHRVDAAQRSTMVSLQSLASQLFGIVGSFALPALAAVAGLPLAWTAAAALLAVAALLLLGIPDRPPAPAIDQGAVDGSSSPSATKARTVDGSSARSRAASSSTSDAIASISATNGTVPSQAPTSAA